MLPQSQGILGDQAGQRSLTLQMGAFTKCPLGNPDLVRCQTQRSTLHKLRSRAAAPQHQPGQQKSVSHPGACRFQSGGSLRSIFPLEMQGGGEVGRVAAPESLESTRHAHCDAGAVKLCLKLDLFPAQAAKPCVSREGRGMALSIAGT